MEPTTIKKHLEAIRLHLTKKELKSAIDVINKLVSIQHSWTFSEKLSELDTHYRYMLHYLVEGGKDPEREAIHDKLTRDIYTLADDAAHHLLVQDSPEFFFEKTRTLNVRTPLTMDEYAEALAKQVDTFSFIGLLEDGPEKEGRAHQNQVAYENTLQDLFYTVYVSPRSKSDQIASMQRFMDNQQVSLAAKCMFITALTMNILQRFDASKITLLLDMCRRTEPELSARVIIGIIPIFQAYRSQWHLYPECTGRLKLLADDPVFNRRFIAALTGFIRAHETEKITQRLMEEIIPEMMKLSPIIGKKINLDEWMGETGIEEKNPEWQKIIDESGLSDKLQELTELQMDGADVFHSTFSNLKSYPFFREVSNWFLPFDPRNSALRNLFTEKGEGTSLIEAMFESSLICDSDKYSFCLSIMMMPENYRKMMIGQLGAEGEEIKKMQEEERALNPFQKEETIIKKYIQNLYRFYKLYPRREEFFDIFTLPLDYHQIEPFYPIVRQPKHLEHIALYYFEKNNFKEAIEAYSLLAEKGGRMKSETWQKIGYSKQMLGDIRGALDAYLHADLIEENNTWVLNRLAYCYRMLKEPTTALEYYRRLEQFRPEDLTIQLNIGHCYLELKQYDEALNYYFKVELLDSNSTRAWRPVAWCAFLSSKFDVAQDYYTRILENSPTAHDFLNAGHVQISLGNIKRAVELYTLSKEKAGSMESFQNLLFDDEEELKQAGVDTGILPFILDKMRYDEAGNEATKLP
ncbi:MAG: tetratricopeptide repeat protein [Bacteroidales bacterium]|nr:tetratricopeptide repeat protein [Bacteroidales bacterium]